MINMLSYQQIKPKTTLFLSAKLLEVDVENNTTNWTFSATTLSKDELVANHKSVLASTKDDDCDLPSIYWISYLQKNPYKQRDKTGSSKCTTKPL